MGLVDIIRGKQKSADDGCATAIRATDEQKSGTFVAKIAVAPIEINEKNAARAKSSPSSEDHRWPEIDSSELDLFVRRKTEFVARGVDEAQSEELADQLMVRDQDMDDRRMCYECNHLKGFARLRCNNWKAAGISMTSDGAFVGTDFGTLLKRCNGFSS